MNRAFVPGVAHQVVAADTLYGEHRTRAQQRERARQRRLARGAAAAVALAQLDLRAATRAGDRLRVVAPVEGITVFALAIGA